VDEKMLQMLARGTPPLPLAEGSAGVSISKPAVERGEPLRTEIESFLAAVRERTRPAVTLADGRRALALALEIHRKIAEHRVRAGLT